MPRFGRYDLLALLSETELSEVWLARQGGESGFEKYVVVKRLHERLCDDPEYIDRFLDEARVNAALHHPNILSVHEVGELSAEGKGRYFLVMEYVEGLPLGLFVQRAIARLGDLPISIACNLVMQAAAALEHSHEARAADGTPLNVVFRDLSPMNLLLGWDGTLKVADFAGALSRGRRSHTMTGTVRGTPMYMAPEQVSGRAVDRRTDVFGLGIMLWELLCARRLFKRESADQTYDAIMTGEIAPPSQHRPELPAALDALVARALSRNAEARFSSAAEMSRALEAVMHKDGLVASSTDVRSFLDRNFARERSEQEALVARVSKAPETAAPIFSVSTHGLDATGYIEGDTDREAIAPTFAEDAVPPSTESPAPMVSPARMESPAPSTSASPPSPRFNRRWLYVVFAVVIVAGLAIGLLVGRSSR